MEKKDNALTVSQLTEMIKTLLEGSFSSIMLKGEISNFKPSSAGHLYFSLKDNDAQISAVMFRGAAMQLNFQPKDGTLILCSGKISVYPPRGNYQFIITSMIKAGAGDIMEMIEQRKRKLAAEGLFDLSRKRILPLLPKTVGVVTSPGGAALRDIINIASRRNSGISIIVFPCLVQGETAANSIEYMINVANNYNMCDVLIVGRGGGSLEDLLPFSEENVVRAVANSKIPVVTAVGHEIDYALCDYASDKRAPTPSAAAEIVFPEKSQLLETVKYYENDFQYTMDAKIKNLRLMLKAFNVENMITQLQIIEQKFSDRYDRAMENLASGISEIIKEKRNRINMCRQSLENCNPQNIFDRGYSMVTDSNGKIIRDAAHLKTGDEIKIKPAKGIITATVSKTGKQ